MLFIAGPIMTLELITVFFLIENYGFNKVLYPFILLILIMLQLYFSFSKIKLIGFNFYIIISISITSYLFMYIRFFFEKVIKFRA